MFGIVSCSPLPSHLCLTRSMDEMKTLLSQHNLDLEIGINPGLGLFSILSDELLKQKQGPSCRTKPEPAIYY